MAYVTYGFDEYGSCLAHKRYACSTCSADARSRDDAMRPPLVKHGNPLVFSFLFTSAGESVKASAPVHRPCLLGRYMGDGLNTSVAGDAADIIVRGFRIQLVEQLAKSDLLAGIPLGAFVQFMRDGVLEFEPVPAGALVEIELAAVRVDAQRWLALALVPLVIA